MASEVIYRFVKGQGWVPGYDDEDLLFRYMKSENDFFQRELERVSEEYLRAAEQLYGIPRTPREHGRNSNFGMPYQQIPRERRTPRTWEDYFRMEQIPRREEPRSLRTWENYFRNEQVPVFIHDEVWNEPTPETTPSDTDALIYMYDTISGRDRR